MVKVFIKLYASVKLNRREYSKSADFKSVNTHLC
jgi:hypothetical protein